MNDLMSVVLPAPFVPRVALDDVFSIGVILYEMSTGVRPFEGTPAQVAAQLLGGEPRPLLSLNAHVPIRLERLIARCMAKVPADRYQSATEVLADLHQVNEPERKVSRAPRPSSPRKPKIESIAVLPFANATGDTQLDYLSDGIAEGVLHQLSLMNGLRVLARSTTFRYRHNPDPVVIGRELKVRAILTGEVSIRRGEVTVSAELVDAKSGAHLWGNAYADAELRTIHGQIAREAGESLNARAALKTPRAPVDEEAYRLYLRGRYALNKWTASSLHSAIQSFQHAIDRDPSFALGFAGLADAFLMFEPFTEAAARGSLDKARAAALRALQIDDSLAEAHTSLAMADFGEWKWEEAEKGFRRAIVLNPNYETAHNWYSMYLITMGRMEEALQCAERAQQIDPLAATVAAHLSACKVMAGRVTEGLGELKRLAEAEPGVPMIHQWLAFAYQRNQQSDLALVEFQKEVESSGNGNLALAGYAYGLCQVGRTDEARQILRKVLDRYDNGEVQPMWVSGIYAGLGETDNALTWLEKAVFTERSATSTYITWPPWFDQLKTEPRYVALLKHMGLVK